MSITRLGLLWLTALLFASAPGWAATVLNINSTITNSGSCTATDNSCPENYLVATVSTVPQNVIVPPAASFGFSDSFNQSGNVSTGSNFGASAFYNPANSSPPWNFQDNILFTTSAAVTQAQAIAQLSNVSNLEIRIISAVNPATGLPFDITAPAQAAALLGGPTVTTIVDGWTNFALQGAGIDYSATMLHAIAAGSYIVQIRGEAAAGSTYSGNITFTPSAVPLPPASIALFSGLLMLVGVLRRPRNRLTPTLA